MDFPLYVYDANKQSFIFEWARHRTPAPGTPPLRDCGELEILGTGYYDMSAIIVNLTIDDQIF